MLGQGLSSGELCTLLKVLAATAVALAAGRLRQLQVSTQARAHALCKAEVLPRANSRQAVSCVACCALVLASSNAPPSRSCTYCICHLCPVVRPAHILILHTLYIQIAALLVLLSTTTYSPLPCVQTVQGHMCSAAAALLLGALHVHCPGTQQQAHYACLLLAAALLA